MPGIVYAPDTMPRADRTTRTFRGPLTVGDDDDTEPLRTSISTWVDPHGETLPQGITYRPASLCAGSYVLTAPLAEGGFGVVYLGEHAASGARAAIKIPHAELAAQPDVLARFEREIEVVRKLRHPNVVEILDAGRLEDGRPWYAMELLTGMDLEAHLEVHGRLPPDEAMAILEPVCAALEAAHQAGVVHRDVKPSNVFLCKEGGRRRVVLLDFGVAKLLDGSGPGLTTSRQIIGTLAYLSPEQLLGLPVDARADIYGLGVLLYAMLVGEPPFHPSTFPVMRQLLLHGGAPRPSLRTPVSPAFDEVVLRAMGREPASRHPSAAAFLAHARAAATLDRRSPDPSADGHVGRALGLYLEVLTHAGALEAPDPALMDDLEGILPAAHAHLLAEGLSAAMETGTSALFVLERPEAPGSDEAARLKILGAALSLHALLQARPDRDPRVRVHLSAHTGELVTSDDGAMLGGDLLDLPAWAPESPEEGVFASPPMLQGLPEESRLAAPKDAALIRLA